MGAMRARRWLWCGNLVLALGFLGLAAWAARYEPPPADPARGPRGTAEPVAVRPSFQSYQPILDVWWMPEMNPPVLPELREDPDLRFLREHLKIEGFHSHNLLTWRLGGESVAWWVGEAVLHKDRRIRLLRVDAALGRERAEVEMGGRRFIATPEGWQAHR